mmetsp:Transcript_48427/g.85340  ORF Transcript_48427/g.85340 Transcript_48427/m.85340 type:complete len:369 (+) Transcript_48427:160-1266(+)
MQSSHGETREGKERKRFGEWNRFLPIIFVVCTIIGLYFIYVCYHCLPMIQSDVPVAQRNEGMRQRGMLQIVIFHGITVLLIICYVRSILEHPGEIPNNDPLWQYNTVGDMRSNFEQMAAMNLQETKKSGDRRHCKWCGKYKPDRCHHCRVCRTCILKMDHHCPWIYNCVGFKNYKYFFLLLLYCVLDLHLIVWTMIESVLRTWNVDTPFFTIFFVLFGETLAIFLGVLVTMFFSFHIWLMAKAMTTIEFCEKKMPKGGSSERADKSVYDTSVYDLGPWGNVRSVLGNNVFTWWLPFDPPSGDGLNYVTYETRLTKDLEAGKGIRRKIHQKVQRTQNRMGSDSSRQGSSRGGQYGSAYDEDRGYGSLST